MDPYTIASGIVTVAVAALVAAVVGRRRGLDKVESEADDSMSRLVSALKDRVSLLEVANREKDVIIADQARQIATLTADVATVKADLLLEQRISRRLQVPR